MTPPRGGSLKGFFVGNLPFYYKIRLLYVRCGEDLPRVPFFLFPLYTRVVLAF